MYFIYILKKYIKNYILILLSLSVFYIIIDLIANYNKLPDSSNLIVLYVYYIFLYSIDIFYPLSLVFAFLLTIYYMIKFNELVSFYSLGFTIKKLLKPFMFFAVLIFALFIGAEFTKYAYVNQYAQAVLNKKQYSNKNLFLKFENKIIYIQKLKPILKEAENLKIFYLNNLKIKRIISGKKAVFEDNIWYIKDADITFMDNKRILSHISDVYVLKNFKPKIISNLKDLNSISLYDAIVAIRIFKDVNINTLLSIVFFKIFTALSMIALLVIIMFKAPIHQRISNVSFFLIKSVLFTILVWGAELMLYKFAKQGVISPYSLSFIFIIMFVYDVYLLIKEK